MNCFIYVFKCGHRVTDTVFMDMIETNPEFKQTELF